MKYICVAISSSRNWACCSAFVLWVEVENTDLFTSLMADTRCSLFNMWFIANSSMHVHQTLFVKCSCKQSCGARRCPASCLFVLFHLTLGQQTKPPSCLNVLNNVSMWMAWSCFQKALWAKGVISYPPHTHTAHPLYPQRAHARTNTPFPLLLHNGFTRRWPCSNEVWSFCDATGKLPCGTVLAILVRLLRFLTAQLHLLTY